MNLPVEHVLEAYRRLAPDEQREAATAILRQVADLDNPPLDDEDLARIADQSFQTYDAREESQDAR